MANVLADVTPKAFATQAILIAIEGSKIDILQLLLAKGYSVHNYSNFWRGVVANCRYHVMHTAVRLLLEHSTKFDGMEKFFIACFHSYQSRFSVATVDIMVRFGLLESASISYQSDCDEFLTTLSSVDDATRLKSEKMELFFRHWPFARVNGSSVEKCVPILSDACRWTIRQSLVRQHYVVSANNINQLPLPIPLRKFLLYEK